MDYGLVIVGGGLAGSSLGICGGSGFLDSGIS